MPNDALQHPSVAGTMGAFQKGETGLLNWLPGLNSHVLMLGVVLLLSFAVPAFADMHEFGSFQVGVLADDGASDAVPRYQVTVENNELLLSRLTANYSGRLSNSFVTDLNKDGDFEVIVTFSYDGGQSTGVHIYTWRDNLLNPHKVGELSAGQTEGYRGSDEYAVANGQLIRFFQLYEQSGDEWVPTAEQRRLRYSFEQAAWNEN